MGGDGLTPRRDTPWPATTGGGERAVPAGRPEHPYGVASQLTDTMVPHDDPAELFEVVSLRYDLLTALEAGPLPKRDLVERVSVSRSTVDRGLHDLRSAGLAADRPDGYTLTVPGRIAVETYERALETVADLQRTMPALATLPPDAPVSPAFLDGCEVVVAEEPAPQRPGSRMDDLVREADRIRCLGRAHTSSAAGDLFRERIEDGGIEATFVLERPLFEYVTEDLDWTDPVYGDNGLTTAVVDSLPYGLFLVETDGTEHACLLAYDDRGHRSLRALLVNDTPAAVDWAETVFDRYREQATPV